MNGRTEKSVSSNKYQVPRHQAETSASPALSLFECYLKIHLNKMHVSVHWYFFDHVALKQICLHEL